MKHIFITIASIITLCNCAEAQKVSHENVTILKPGTTLYIVTLNNGTQIKTKDLLVSFLEMPEKGVEIITLSKIKQYTGDNKVNMIVIFKLKPDVNLLSLNQILDKYHIDDQYKNYKILIDDTEVNDKSNLWISEAQINEIIAYPDQKCLDIRGKLYQNGIKMRKGAEEQRLKNIELYKKTHLQQ